MTDTDTIQCQGCDREFERAAEPGQTLQPSAGYTCDECSHNHNVKVGAVDAERQRVLDEINAQDGE